MHIAVSNPSVAPHVQQTVLAYAEANTLSRFYTTFYDHPENRLARALSALPHLSSEIHRRAFPELPARYFRSHPLPELLRVAASRYGGAVLADRIWEWAETGFDNWVASGIRKTHPDAVHTYEHAALATLKQAKKSGVLSIYEQSSAHHAAFSRILAAQLAAHPQIRNATLDLKKNRKSVLRNARRDEELSLAGLIICNSSFTAKTLTDAGIDRRKIEILPLGFPAVKKSRVKKASGSPVVFLHAGNQSVTKASHIVYQAWEKCAFPAGDAELWLIGKMALPENLRQNLRGTVRIMPHVPHAGMQDVYAGADVLLAPSLADGFGMVITEAMANGVPVIASTNCCGPDLISPGKNGWIVPAGDADALAGQMQACVRDRHTIFETASAAAEKAQSWQWADYRLALATLIQRRFDHR